MNSSFQITLLDISMDSTGFGGYSLYLVSGNGKHFCFDEVLKGISCPCSQSSVRCLAIYFSFAFDSFVYCSYFFSVHQVVTVVLLCGLQTIQITSNSKCYSTFVITYIPETCSLCFLICSCSSKGAELCNKTSRLYAENAVKVSDTRYLHIYACMSSFKFYEM